MIADKRREKTIDILLADDQEYRKMEETAITLGKVYDSLELNPDIRETVDNLLAERDGMNIERVSLAYWAGMRDAITILREMKIIAF